MISNPLPKAKITDLCFMEFPPLSIPVEPGCKFSADFRLHLESMGWRSAQVAVLCLLFSSCQPLFLLLSDFHFFSTSSSSTKHSAGEGGCSVPQPWSNPEPKQEARAGRSCAPDTGRKKCHRGRPRVFPHQTTTSSFAPVCRTFQSLQYCNQA